MNGFNPPYKAVKVGASGLDDKTPVYEIDDANGVCVSVQIGEPALAFVRVLNSHSALVGALETLRMIVNEAIPYGNRYCAALDVIDAALRAATGEQA